MLLVVSDPSHQVDQADYDAFLAEPDADDRGIPVLRVRRMQVAALLQVWGLDGIAAMIERDLIPRSRALEGAEVDYTEFLARNVRTVRNVVGILPGTDSSRQDEAVVIGAHYDHVGLGGRYSVTPERTGEVHNGADDNASGTSAVIEMAKAAAADPSRFPRTLVFVAFAGEERGLLGSAHYANNPAVPLSKTVAMLNLDMVGRSKGKVQTSGLEKAPSLEPDLLAAAKTAGFAEVGREGPGSGRSDDASFLQRRIPSIIFFTGFHGDYHRPGDDWDKIDAAGTARVATLALELAARIAARRDRPAFVD
jgi:Zn-dependent M28 family amino/carboxypeptidase